MGPVRLYNIRVVQVPTRFFDRLGVSDVKRRGRIKDQQKWKIKEIRDKGDLKETRVADVVRREGG